MRHSIDDDHWIPKSKLLGEFPKPSLETEFAGENCFVNLEVGQEFYRAADILGKYRYKKIGSNHAVIGNKSIFFDGFEGIRKA